MKKNSVVFIDSSAWCAIVDGNDTNHIQARDYFSNLLQGGVRLVTCALAVDKAVDRLKMRRGPEDVRRFLNVINESVLTVHLKVDWASRRVRRMVLESFLKNTDGSLTLHYFYIAESLKRKKADILFSFDPEMKKFDVPVMPQHKV